MIFVSASDISIGEAAVDAVVGFVIVLAVLALLVGIFYLSGFIFKSKVMSRDKLFSFKKKPKSVEPELSFTDVEGDDDEQTVAAITAALSVILSEESGGEAPEFVIRRVTRK